MYATDFIYDGTKLSDLGLIICTIGSGGDENSSGSNITFSTVPIFKGEKYLSADARYEECLSTSFQITKNPCLYPGRNTAKFTMSEISTIMRWLNQKTYKQLTFVDSDYSGIIFEGSFNVGTIEFGDGIYALDLTFNTNRPFAIKSSVSKTFTLNSSMAFETINDISDEIGYIYPTSMSITCLENGDLSITNSIENRVTTIKNCVVNEVITMNHPVISSSIESHSIQNDFNYNFFRIANTSASRENKITATKSCTISIAYNPIIKITI